MDKNQILETIAKSVKTVVIVATEIAVVGYAGSLIGVYVGERAIQADCAKVGIAKVGDGFIECKIVVPRKDLPTDQPR